MSPTWLMLRPPSQKITPSLHPFLSGNAVLKNISLLLITLVCCGGSFASQLPDYPFIHITGLAYAKVQPDFGEILFDIAVSDVDPDAAFNMLSGRLIEIKTLLASQNIADSDIVIRDLKEIVGAH